MNSMKRQKPTGFPEFRRLSATVPLLALALLSAPLATNALAGESAPKAGKSASQLVLTLDEAVRLGLRQNPDILKQLQEIQRTKGVIIEVLGAALPNVTANGAFTYTDPYLTRIGRSSSGGTSTVNLAGGPYLIPGVNGGVLDIGSLLGGSGSGRNSSDSYSVSFSAKQLLFNGGSTFAAVRAAQLTKDNAFYQLRETVEQTVNTIRTQFYTVLLNESLITIQQEQVGLLASQLKDQQNRFEAGTVPRFDVLQAEVALANQRPLLISAQNNFKLAQIQLARTLGVDYNNDILERPPFRLLGKLDVIPLRLSIPEAVSLAEQNRASLKLARQNIQIQQETLKVQRGNLLPSVSANVNYALDNDARRNGLGYTDSGYTAGVSATWNIFDGGSTYGRIRQSRALIAQAAITYADAVRGVELDVQTALLNLRQARELINSQTQTVGQAEEALRLSRARLSAGAGTQLDVLNSQVALSQAQVTELQARYNYNVAFANLRYYTGTSTIYQDNFTDPANRRDAALQAGKPQSPAARKLAQRSVAKPEGQKVDADHPERGVRPAPAAE